MMVVGLGAAAGGTVAMSSSAAEREKTLILGELLSNNKNILYF